MCKDFFPDPDKSKKKKKRGGGGSCIFILKFQFIYKVLWNLLKVKLSFYVNQENIQVTKKGHTKLVTEQHIVFFYGW